MRIRIRPGTAGCVERFGQTTGEGPELWKVVLGSGRIVASNTDEQGWKCSGTNSHAIVSVPAGQPEGHHLVHWRNDPGEWFSAGGFDVLEVTRGG